MRTGGPTTPDSQQHFPVRLTQAQRKVVAEIAPELADRLKLDERNQRTIQFTLAELKAIKEKAGKAIRQASTGMVRNSLRHVTDLAAQALERSHGLGAIPAAERVYQFKITLLDASPRSGGASRSRTARSTSSTNTSRRRWAGPTGTCTTSGYGSSFTATPS